jgi:hypothetical protein
MCSAGQKKPFNFQFSTDLSEPFLDLLFLLNKDTNCERKIGKEFEISNSARIAYSRCWV